VIYQEIKGKVSRGERLKAITNKELVSLYIEKIGRKVTPVPQQGITPESLRLKKYAPVQGSGQRRAAISSTESLTAA